MPPVDLAAPSMPAPAIRHAAIRIDTTRRCEFVDITTQVGALVNALGLTSGIVTVQTRHTTTGLMINEFEPLLLEDLEAMFERIVPASIPYTHDDFARRCPAVAANERPNGDAHCRAALLRASESLVVFNGELSLGRWQRLIFVDFDGGQRREIVVALWGTFRGRGRGEPHPLTLTPYVTDVR
jgi:secondary thiamine-phosphate synthase enzyme